jgi:NAD(P)-dependent dehydrogenase (short-subunit alcohol dehydrogenase family)
MLALLTGVGREGQVGEVVARVFAERGATVLLVDRQADQAEARASALADQGHRASAYGCDLTNADDVGALAARVRGDHGERLDAIVNMAGGFAASGTVAEGAVDVWHRMLAINLTTAYLSTRAFLPLVRAGRGAIVYFASEAALPGSRIAGTAPYAAAKSGVVALMQAVAQECVAKGFKRIDLNVLDWNPARGFYERIGFKWIRAWLPYRLSGEALEKLAHGKTTSSTSP